MRVPVLPTAQLTEGLLRHNLPPKTAVYPQGQISDYRRTISQQRPYEVPERPARSRTLRLRHRYLGSPSSCDGTGRSAAPFLQQRWKRALLHSHSCEQMYCPPCIPSLQAHSKEGLECMPRTSGHRIVPSIHNEALQGRVHGADCTESRPNHYCDYLLEPKEIRSTRLPRALPLSSGEGSVTSLEVRGHGSLR